MGLSDYVAVSISIASAAVAKPAFSVMLILGYSANFPAGTLTRSYTGIDAVAADFAETTAEYQAAARAFDQNPQPQSLKIGYAPALVAGAGTVTLAAPPVAGDTIGVTVNGIPVSTAFNTSAAQTMSALAQAIAAVPGIASAAVDGANPDQIDITGIKGSLFSVTLPTTSGPGAPAITATVQTASLTLANALDAISAVDADWYGLAIVDNTDANIDTVAAWTQSQMKLFCVSSQDAAIVSAPYVAPGANASTDLASLLFNKGYTRTLLLYHATAGEFPECAWLAGQLLNPPGSATFAFKGLVGVTPDGLTPSQIANAKAKNCNLYITVAGAKITDPGITAAGAPYYADIVFGLDWLQSSIQTDVFALLASTKKVPFTDHGAHQIGSIIRTDLNRAVTAGVLADDGSVSLTVPKVTDQNPTDRANRIFDDFTFTGNLAGAIQKVRVVGTVSV